ncbi:hypothetical protein ACTXT7_013877 [Hymenolepis weldensis]
MPQCKVNYNSLATQLSNYSDMEVRISSIVRSTLTQKSFSTSIKDPKDNAKHVGIFHHNPLIKKTFAAWNSMADLRHLTQITTLPREFNRSAHYLCLSYFQPMDPANLIYEWIASLADFALVSDLVLSKTTNLNVSFLFLVFDLLVMLRFDPETALSKTSLPELQRKWSQRRLLLRIFCEQFNEAEPEQKDGINSKVAKLWQVNAAPSRHDSTYPCKATFLEKTIFKQCHVTDRNINPVGLDWIDELNLIQFPDENETRQTPTLESRDVENLVRACNQCQHVTEMHHLSIHIQSLKPDFPRTQL